jgi:hypothetical protein
LRAWPTIVAESLVAVPDPLGTALVTPAPATPAHVVAALAAGIAPPLAGREPPAWLWPTQAVQFRRVLAAVTRFGGALLADPVGSGKTYVALAAAAALNGARSTVALVPAALVQQWQAAAAQVNLPVVAWSHERVRRGSFPPQASRLVVIDECHRFRNPGTRGYAHLAPWLMGRRTLLLSATPVVNRLSDLAAQLRLAVRDDALAPNGVPSISMLLDTGRGHVALGLLVLAAPAPAGTRPRASEHVEQLEAEDDLNDVLEEIDRLALSPDAGTAALLRTMLWRAAASSPAALAAALRRYRRLLLHARDAARGGHPPNRGTLLRLTNGVADQLLLWELLPSSHEPVDLVPADLPRLERLAALAEGRTLADDAKLIRLRRVLADRRPTLVFTVARETVRWLRDRLGPRVAWCTGDRAGVGPLRASRRAVFEWFRAEGPARRAALPEGTRAPLHLVATDLAAEGLDLQGAERVVHYDLPWTPMRLDQRRGRVVRAGSPHSDVVVIRFEPAPPLQRRLGQAELLASKAALPSVIGLGDNPALWRWRAEVAARFADVAPANGAAAVQAELEGVLAGFSLREWPDTGAAPLAAHLLWWDERSGWSEHPDVLLERLHQASAAGPAPFSETDLRRMLVRLGGVVRERIRSLRRARWEAPAPGPAARTLLARLELLARAAARERNPGRLALVQRAIGFAAGGHTAGEAMEIERLAGLPVAALQAALERVPAGTQTPDAVEARITGVILFRRAATFPRCRHSAPCSSISTAP